MPRTQTTSFVDRITRIERHPGYTGRNGNPRWLVSFAEHDTLPTEVDGSVGYGINNSEYREGLVEVTVTSRGSITYLKPVKT